MRVQLHGALGVVLAVAIALAGPACGGKGGGKSGGSGGAGGQAGVGIDGSAGSDAPLGTDADHTVTTWPDFPPGKCAPMKPAVLESPGVVDPETLCERRLGDEAMTPLALGEWGYGSIGLIDTSTEDTSWPDSDTFVMQPGPPDGSIMRITVEALPGAELQPQLTWYGGGLGAIWPLPGDLSRAHQEVLVTQASNLQLTVTDKRAQAKGDTYGVGAVYRLRVDLVEKTPVDPGPLPVKTTGDFTSDGLVAVYSFTVPNERGRLLVDIVGTAPRPSGLPASPVATDVLIYDPVKKKRVQYMLPGTFTTDQHLNYEVEPMYPGLGVAPGSYWLMFDTPSAAAALSRTDYDLSIQFRGMPPNDKCTGAIDVTPTGSATRTTMGDTTFAGSDTALSYNFVSSACYQAIASFAPLTGKDVVYSVVVPGRKRLTAKVTPVGGWHPAIWMGTNCSAGEISCVAAAAPSSSASSGPQSVAWTNVSTGDRTIFITVDSSQDSGEFSLETSFTDGPAAPANDTCAGVIALDLTSGLASISSATTEGAGDDEHPGAQSVSAACKDTAANYNGADVVYSAVVPAGKRLSVTAFPSGTFNPALWISETCANPEASCLAARDGDGTRENVVWTNTGTTDKPVVIHVDAQDPVGGMFSLSASLGAPKACPTTARDPAVAYVSRTNNAGNDFIFTSANVAAACASAVTAPLIGDDDITAFDVPAGKTLSLTIKSTITLNGAPADKWVGLLTTACGTVAESGAACVAAGTSLSWKNAGAATQRVFLFMDLASRSPAEADYNVIPSLM